MNHRLLATLSCLPLIAALPSLPAQAALPITLPRVPIHTAEPDLGVDYGIWAATDRYKVSFHDGMTFVPYLGDEYPHNQPWSWRTTSVGLGRAPLLPANASPAHRHTDFRYEYDFGPIVEAYDVRQDGLEQTFVLRTRPVHGDLVIQGAVTSAMTSPIAPAAHQELTFADAAGTPILVYGKAWAIDANGNRVAIATAHQDGVITLTVPGEWLAHAALPVVVDPLLFVFGVTAGTQVKSVDVCFVREHIETIPQPPPLPPLQVTFPDYTYYCRVVAASQFDDDVIMIAFSVAGVGVVFSDVTSNWDSDDANCASNGLEPVLVFRRYFAGNPIRTSQLRCHADGSLSSVSGLSTALGINDWRPDIGGLSSEKDRVLVVFQREDNTNTAGHWAQTTSSGVYGVFLFLGQGYGVDGTFGTPFAIHDTGFGDAERPCVNLVSVPDSATFYSWLCAFQLYTNPASAGDDWDVHARRVNSNGLVTLAMWQSQLGTLDTHHQLAPAIAGSAGRYAITFATTDIATTPGHSGNVRGKEVWVERIDWPHTAPAPAPSHAPARLAVEATNLLETTGIAMDRHTESHWGVGYRSWTAGANTAFAARVGYRGIATEGPLPLHGAADQSQSSVRCAYDTDRAQFAFGYGLLSSGTHYLAFRRLTYTTPRPVMVTGTSCSGVGLSWTPGVAAALPAPPHNLHQQIGAEGSEIRVSGAAASTIHLLALSMAPLDVPVDLPGLTPPGCRLLVDTFGPGYLGAFSPAVGASATWPLPLPELLQSMTLHFQDWTLDAGVLASSQRLEVPIVK